MTENIKENSTSQNNEEESEETKTDGGLYFIIDNKNSFIIDETNDRIGKLNKTLNENDDYLQNNSQINSQIISSFFEKIYNKTNINPFTISKKISEKFYKTNKTNKQFLEEKVDYFYSKRNDFKRAKILNSSLEIVRYIGYILCYTYHKLSSYKIYDNKDMVENIKKTLKDMTDALTDFYCYYNSKGLEPNEHKKTDFWKKNANNYYLPGVFIFLINIFAQIEIVEIDFNFGGEKLSEEDVDFFIISVVNYCYILTKIKKVKINFINKKLQCDVYGRYFRGFQEELKNNQSTLKKTFFNIDSIYNRKWDFETDFLLGAYRASENDKFLDCGGLHNFGGGNESILDPNNTNNMSLVYKEESNNISLNNSNYIYNNSNNYSISSLPKTASQSFLLSNTTGTSSYNKMGLNESMSNNNYNFNNSNNMLYSLAGEPKFEKSLSKEIKTGNDLDKNNNLNNFYASSEKNIISLNSSTYNEKSFQKSKTTSTSNLNNVSNNYGTFSFSNINAGYNYYPPRRTEFTQFNAINPNRVNSNQHYYDIIKNNTHSLQMILITINSLIYFENLLSFDLVMNDSYKAEFMNYFLNIKISLKDFHILDIITNKIINLQSLNIEINILDFYTFEKILLFIESNENLSDLQISLFSSDVTYFQQTIYKIYKQNYQKTNLNLNENEILSPENKILNKLLPNFIDNLSSLFELIRNKNLETLGINFDTPYLINIKQRYMIVILKFLINILLMVNNINSKVKQLILLSPSTKIDSRIFPRIENILSCININKNNKNLIKLSLHLQLYEIKNITNMISNNLQILNIGDCDIKTFNHLTNFLSSYEFCKVSQLSKISISLLQNITNYNSKIKKIFYKIFAIKIKQLEEINIYTNLFIEDKDKYLNLLTVFENNWISKCRLTLNKRAEHIFQIYEQEKNNKFIYLIPHCLEDKLLLPEEIVIRNNLYLSFDKEDDIYWILKNVFYKKFGKKRDFSKYLINKKIIFNILKFSYFNKPVEIEHQLKCNTTNNQ